MRNARFYTALAVYTGSILLGGAMLAKADTIETAALYAAQEYACEWPDYDRSEALLALAVKEGMPEDIAVEIIADLAWQIVETSTSEWLCGSVVAEVR
ncbi:hypothetical protein EET67_04925 [Pseudaminobacter arsenicus]|uniref:DUF732 domain-containing protein n=1 Tax=Borborobacter arsenicus TaxID=1851146 RepID=A0A432V9Y6_9HYPH|nr:hypothetical protein [Pseudaminobacter arsenicus]RUM98987.1 hypothetical protein EET67_04925 [Pseudaminobacter arsenicus]